MRALFFLLLLVNLLMFGWIMHGSTTAEQPRVADPVPGVDPITLLRELDDGPQAAAQAPVIAAEDAAAEAAGTAGEPVVAAVEDDAAAPVSPPPAETELAPATVAGADSCHTVGPFRDIDKLREVIKAIRGEALEASFRSREESEQSLFWVYLPPAADLAGAKTLTRKLRQNGIKDSYIINDGDKRFGISLGHFREKPRAYGLRDSIAALGFGPRIEPVFRSYTIYWLDYRLAAGRNGAGLLQGLELDEGVSRFNRDCA